MGRAAGLLVVVMIVMPTFHSSALAQAATCKQCEDQQKACKRNYSAETCKVEYQICRKSCKK